MTRAAMSALDQLYSAAPLLLQEVATTWYGWRVYRRRYKGIFAEEARRVRERESWSTEQFIAYQIQQLRQIGEVARHSPFYRERFQLAGFDPAALEKPADLSVLPLLSRDQLRLHGQDMLTARPEHDVTTYKSSGTSGTPRNIYRSRRMDQMIWAYWDARCWNWFGASHRSRKAVFGVRKVHPVRRMDPPFWRHDWLTGICYFSIYHLRRENLAHYCRELQRFAPELMLAYPSAIYPVARFALDEGVSLPRPRGIVTTSETLSAEQRRTIEQAFGCRIYDQYGAAEACVFGATCEQGHLHVSPDFGYLEVLKADGKPAEPGEMGEVVCTGFLNELQPLIRYQLGDVVRLSRLSHCACGRNMPIIEEICGRVEDMLHTVRGDPVIRFGPAFKGVHGIREGQVVQRAKDLFIVRIVPDPGFSADEEATLIRNMELHLGPGHVIRVEKVAQIPRTASGKFRAVVNEMASSA